MDIHRRSTDYYGEQNSNLIIFHNNTFTTTKHTLAVGHYY